jgi:hypothetical protein
MSHAELRFHLRQGRQSVAELKRLIGLSESRIRELLKVEPEAQSTDERPARFFIPDAPPAAEPIPVEAITPAEEVGTMITVDTPTGPALVAKCPLCGSEEPQERAGAEGEYLGGCLICPSCGDTYNEATGQKLTVAPETEAKKRKAPQNPQYKINAKVDAVTKAGGTLAFDRQTRRWTRILKGKTREFTAAEFAAQTPETILG